VDLEVLTQRFKDLLASAGRQGLVAESGGMKEVLTVADRIAVSLPCADYRCYRHRQGS